MTTHATAMFEVKSWDEKTWDGKDWKITSDWYTSDDSVIAPMVKDAAAKYAAEKKLTPGCLVTN